MTRPPLYETDDLCKVVGVSLLTSADELQVERDARKYAIAGVTRDEISEIAFVPLVEHGHDVHI